MKFYTHVKELAVRCRLRSNANQRKRGIDLRIVHVILALGLGLVVAGCASVGNESLRHLTREGLESQLENGKTTKEDVRVALGDPNTTDFTDSGNEIWKYRHVRTQAKVENFIPVVDLLASGQDVTTKEVALFFDQDGLLRNYSMIEVEDEVRTGLITANM
jgi:outer membrane protein assembly factor BamE (lipoprotein component of BamABCDE complex)